MPGALPASVSGYYSGWCHCFSSASASAVLCTDARGDQNPWGLPWAYPLSGRLLLSTGHAQVCFPVHLRALRAITTRNHSQAGWITLNHICESSWLVWGLQECYSALVPLCFRSLQDSFSAKATLNTPSTPSPAHSVNPEHSEPGFHILCWIHV